MPASHEAWETIAEQLPQLLRTYRLNEVIDNMPLLNADFDDRYLDRASMLISSLAHAYCFQEKKPLPPQLEIPWNQITQRLGRDGVMRTASDDFLHNYRFRNPSLPNPMQIHNLDTPFPYFLEQEDQVMNLTVTLTEHHFAPALTYIAMAQTALLNGDDETLMCCLVEINKILRKVSQTFSHLSPNPYSPTYVDPVIWGRCSPPAFGAR